MKKLLLAFLTVAVLVATVPNTVAQDYIFLGASATNSLKFTGTGAGNLTMGWNNKGGTWGNANASGVGINGTSCGGPCVGTYTFTQSSPINFSLTTPGCSATCIWSVSMANNALLFDFGPSPKGSNTGQWLTADVQIESLTQVHSGGLFHDTMVADLTVLGGLLSQFFPTGSVLDLNLSFTMGQDLSKLGRGRSVSDGIGSGDVIYTPEPGTMALLGSGILLLGGYLRRRKNV